MFRFLTALCVFIGVIALPAHANDSEAETSLGGLTLKQSEHISMDSEFLFISAQKVVVKYRFTNHSDKDVTTLVAFPLPAQPNLSEGFAGDQRYPKWPELKFQTKIDGKPVELNISQRFEAGGKDVSARLMQLGWPERWFEDYAFLERLQKMDAQKLRGYMDEGLITASDDGNRDWLPRWQLVAQISREQIFPAGKTVRVEHRYSPLTGGSVGGALTKHIRDSEPQILKYYQNRYCVDDYFLKGFDRRSAAKAARSSYHSETWIGYILSSGANWKGPIKDFRLVIDKGSPDNLVSFCMDGVKKITPTLFEVQKQNFEPTDDLNILIVEWFGTDG